MVESCKFIRSSFLLTFRISDYIQYGHFYFILVLLVTLVSWFETMDHNYFKSSKVVFTFCHMGFSQKGYQLSDSQVTEFDMHIIYWAKHRGLVYQNYSELRLTRNCPLLFSSLSEMKCYTMDSHSVYSQSFVYLFIKASLFLKRDEADKVNLVFYLGILRLTGS